VRPSRAKPASQHRERCSCVKCRDRRARRRRRLGRRYGVRLVEGPRSMKHVLCYGLEWHDVDSIMEVM
jgi:hypothetical protein